MDEQDKPNFNRLKPSNNGENKVAQDVPVGNLYDILGAAPISPLETIHVQFLKKIKMLLLKQMQGTKMLQTEFLERLRSLCVAHDVLNDPVTRTDYDFRLLGVRKDGKKDAAISGQENLRVGELLVSVALLDDIELDIALALYTTIPNMSFGQFLVAADYVLQEELDYTLLGQKLIMEGKITIAQFQVAMRNVKIQGVTLEEALLAKQWINQNDLRLFNHT